MLERGEGEKRADAPEHDIVYDDLIDVINDMFDSRRLGNNPYYCCRLLLHWCGSSGLGIK